MLRSKEKYVNRASFEFLGFYKYIRSIFTYHRHWNLYFQKLKLCNSFRLQCNIDHNDWYGSDSENSEQLICFGDSSSLQPAFPTRIRVSCALLRDEICNWSRSNRTFRFVQVNALLWRPSNAHVIKIFEFEIFTISTHDDKSSIFHGL